MRRAANMGRRLKAGAVLLVLLVVAGIVIVGARDRPAAEQVEKALAREKPLLLFFSAHICTACEEVEAVIDALRPEFAKEIAFVVVDFNKAENEELIEEFAVDVIPVVFVLSRTGEQVAKIVGVGKEKELRQALASQID